MGIFNPILENGSMAERSTGETPILEGYDNGMGGLNLALDCITNDYALFEAAIKNDFKETTITEASELQAFNEASIKGLGQAIVKGLKMFRDKVLSIIAAARDFFMNKITRDNKTYVEKYQAETDKKDLSKMKYKWSQSRFGDVILPETINKSIDGIKEEAEKAAEDIKDKIESAAEVAVDSRDKEVKIQSPEHKAGLLKDIFSIDGHLDYRKAESDVKAHFYHGPSDTIGLSKDRYESIKKFLVDSKELTDGLKTLEKNTKEGWNKIIKNVEDVVTKGLSDGSNDPDPRDVTLAQTAGKVLQEVHLKAVNIIIEIYKFKVTEARAVFARAVAFGGTPVSESDVDIEINIDSADDDTGEMIDQDVEDAIDEAFYGAVYC